MISFFKNNNYLYFIRPKAIFFLMALILLGLYIYVGNTSFGFPDEYWTIRNIEKFSDDWLGLYNFLLDYYDDSTRGDVHPPLSYFIVFNLYKIFKSWQVIRVIISITLIFSIINFSNYLRRVYGQWSGVACLFFLGLDPSVLMWGISIRWYSFYLIFLLWFLIIPRKINIWFNIKLIVGLVLLGYTGYITILIAIPLIIYYYKDRFGTIYQKFRSTIIHLFIFLLIYGKQLQILFTTQFAYSINQTSLKLIGPEDKTSYLTFFSNNIKGFIAGILSNQGVMPYSLAGFLSILSTSFILFYSFRNLIKRFKNIDNSFVFISALSLFLISGLGSKFRSYVVLTPLRSIWISTIKRSKYTIAISLILIGICQLQGIVNIISHSGTTKTFFNIPFHRIINEVESFSSSCKAKPIIFHHEKALTFHLNRMGYDSISTYEPIPYNTAPKFRKQAEKSLRNKLEKKLNSSTNSCVIAIDTFRGFSGISKTKKNMMMKALDDLDFSKRSVVRIGKNKDLLVNRTIDIDYPLNTATIYKLRGVKNLKKMNAWLKN